MGASTQHASDDSVLQSGVSHLDQIMGGGVPVGSLVLVMGLPGSGKTTLASQIAFTAAREGRTVLILTALSESTGKLIAHLSHFAFFDPDLIGGPVQFLSLQDVLSQGLKAAGDEIISEARRVKAELVILDGFRGMDSVDSKPHSAREFLYEIGTTLNALKTTMILTSEIDPRDPTFFPETTTVDMILGMHYQLVGVRQFRSIEVIKVRGAAPLPGLHTVTISTNGVNVYPQLEERIAAELLGGDAQMQGAATSIPIPPSEPPVARARVTFDQPELDAMLGGGIPSVTCTLLAGSVGAGKTLLALYYALAGVRAGEKVVFLGFRESRDQLLQAADAFTIGPELLAALQPEGGLTFIEALPIKINPDILAEHLLAVLDRTGAQRLVIDSIEEVVRGIQNSADSQRLEDYLAALLRAFRARQVTALLIKETPKALSATLDFSSDALSVLAENVLLLQQVPFHGQLHRIISILKLRFSDHDTSLREFRIVAPDGLEVLQPFQSDSGVLPGITQDQEDAQTNRQTPEKQGS